MPRYIDADELITFVEDRYEITWESDTYEGGIKDACTDILEKIDSMLTADVAPVRHGRWVYGENEGQDGWYCSECHFFIPWYYDWYGLDNIDFIKDFHACPHCSAKMVTYTGAKMDGGDGDA